MNKIVTRGIVRMVVSSGLALLLLVSGGLFCSAKEDTKSVADSTKTVTSTMITSKTNVKTSDTLIVKVLEVTNARLTNKDRARIGDNIIVKVDSLKSLLSLAGDNIDRIGLKIEGRVIPGLKASRTGDDNSLEFKLEKNKENEAVWDSLAVKTWADITSVKVSLVVRDMDQKRQLDMRDHTFKLVKPLNFNAILFVFGIVLFAVTFLKLDKWCPWCSMWKCDARLRDYGPDSTYSLARVQMALWYYVVTMSFLYLYFSSGYCIPALNDSTLILLGISTLTTLSASVVDSSKKDKANEKETQKEAQKVGDKGVDGAGDAAAALNADCPLIVAPTPAASKHHNFIMDILSDEYGVNLTRFQNVVWTLILAVIFIEKVLNEAAIPDFSDTNLLTLMGISSSSYVLYKLKEAAP